MSIKIDPISTIIETGAKAVETVAGVFSENSEKAAQRSADEQKALLNAYQAEFNQRTNRTWIDAIADGFNRLVRPVIVTIIISIFVIAYFSPQRFTEISLAMGSIPGGYWALLSVIISFYFGGRMQLKSQDFQLQSAQVNAVKALIETKKEFRKLEQDNDEPDRVLGDAIGKDSTIEEARQGERNEVVAAYIAAMAKDKQAEKLSETIKQVKEASKNEEPYIFQINAMTDS
ncbi:MAG: holin family protein [Candidatus Polarisedimenticolaceae bacterium]|nr:holin family protein [Candidatus Polarisedimenticolaceae bacterium]